MPRPERIEYPHAYHHVMNQGRGRTTIFLDDRYYQLFLDTLSEVNKRFDCIVHAYCLMGNHYHLLLETPNANLSRIMRHINGVYTQRYNRLKGTDGPLFRGRYKAILVDKDAYLLHLTRYIHRNPIDMKRPLVAELADYRWSSYPAYIGKAGCPAWLEREMSYKMLGGKQRYKAYANYVAVGVDEDTKKFYHRGNVASIVGDKDFKSWVFDELLPELEAGEKSRVINPQVTMESIVRVVAKHYQKKPSAITAVVKGPQKENEARKIAMYLCQELAAEKLVDIADYFNLSHSGSVSYNSHQVRKKKQETKGYSKQIGKIIESIAKQAT